ncbi:uncharacterized protein LOC131435292 [Malaya genurostris]|uniref:uncharacterized protein LOC131435292 n=1 Tax=Malaya genurostris TaxID=325434 RepID=UPI0026F38836|nr:uncharacterized protein LOC131435292 [Malaya genurostris]
MLVLLHFVLVIALLSLVKNNLFYAVHANQFDDQGLRRYESEAELAELKELFYKNIMVDIRIESEGQNLTPDMKHRLDERIDGFLRVASGTDRIGKQSNHLRNVKHKEFRRKPRSATDKSMNDDIGRERLYLKGFRERGYIPVNFPIDICMLKVGKSVFAASINIRKTLEGYANHSIVSFYSWDRDTKIFHKYMEYTAILARKFDCISHASLGFVAVVNYHNNTREKKLPLTNQTIDEGSPVFQIMENSTTEIVQKFSQSNQNTVHMWIHGNHVYLTHTYTNLDESVANVCPIYRWSGYHFDAIDELPCYNAIHIEPFTIEQTMFLALANQMNDEAVDEDTFSDLFKFDYEKQKFDFHQKIYIYSVSHMAYIFLDHGDMREHFLITGNSRAGKKNKAGKLDYDQHSIMYKYIDGYFVPFQKFELYRVKRFLPVMRENGEFLLLILCRGRPMLIYEYDGWKFTPSRIDYTREAFAVGISQMRVYRHIINASLIVIANRNLHGSDANIFSPIYGIENDLKSVYEEFINWCERTTKELDSVDLEDVYNRFLRLPEYKDDAHKIKNIRVKGTSIETLRTSSVHIGQTVLDQRTIDYVNKAHQRLEKISERVAKLERIVDDSLMQNETLKISGNVKVPQIFASEAVVKDLKAKNVNDAVYQRSTKDQKKVEAINADRLIVDGDLDVEYLNGHPSEALLHTTDFQFLKNVDLYGTVADFNGELFVNNLIDGIRFTTDNVVINGMNQVFANKTIRVNELKVNNLITKTLNSTKIEPLMSYIDQATKKIIDSCDQGDGDFREIRVNNLELTGLFNGIDLNNISKHTFKIKGDQVITTKLSFDNIVASNIEVPSKRLSGVDLNSLVRINPTADQPDFTVRQDVHFMDPVYIERLEVEERINHISVIDGHLQVLKVNSSEPQIITGTKSFDNVVLLDPIDLRGKITSSSLRKLSTVTTLTNDIHLEGDFEISGDVTVEVLNASNIYGSSRTYNFVDLYSHGVPLNAASSNQNFTFKQPLIANKVFATSLNGVDPSDFIYIKANKTQVITGRKIFTGNVTLREGRAEAAVINNVDLKYLNETILKRTGDQVIKGSIHFKKLIVSRVGSNNSLFEGKQLDSLVTNSNKDSKSKLRCKKCKLRIENDLNVRNLFTTEGSTVYGYDLEQMFADTLQKNSNESEQIVITGHKRFHNVTVGELILVEQATLNEMNLKDLHEMYDVLQKDIVIEEELILNGEVHVKNLFVNGSINGVSKEDFGSVWLLKEYDQTFTAPQTFENIIANTTFIEGKFNGIKLEELIQNLYFLNKDEHIKSAIFHEGFVSSQPVMVHGLVSGLDLEKDILLNYSTEPQQLEELRIDGNLLVTGQIKIGSTLNGMNYVKLQEFTSSSGLDQPINIEVQGNVHFQGQTDITELNGYNLKQLHRDAWLSNRNNENITGRFRFEQVRFEENVYVKGPINGLYLDEISESYLSLTKPRNITTPLIFKGSVEFRDHTTIGNIALGGLLKGSPESKGFDIVYFDKYVLRKDVEQTITGRWTFHEVEIQGDLNLTTINGINLEKDLLLSNAQNVTFTGNKRFKNVHIDNLECPTPCIIQGVDVTEWFANAVRLDQNFTTAGVTNVEDATILGDVEVLGAVNNYAYDKDKMIIKPVTSDNKTFGVNINKLPQELDSVDQLKNIESKLRRLYMIEQSMVESLNTKMTYLSHYESVKGLNGGFQALYTIMLSMSPKPLQLLIAHVNDGVRTAVEFYRWSRKESQFLIARGFPPISSPTLLVTNCKRINVGHVQYLFVEFYSYRKQYYRQSILDLERSDHVAPKKISKFVTLYEFNSTIPRKAFSLKILDLNCIGLFSPHANGVEIYCLHLDNLVYYMQFYQSLNVAPVDQALYLDGRLIVLRRDHLLQIWRPKPNRKLVLSQSINFSRPAFITAAKFENQLFIAVKLGNILVENDQQGSIEIWHDSRPHHRNSTFTHYQTILRKQPKQIKFSVIPSTDDLMLYTLSDDSSHPLVIYRYEGVAGFREFLTCNTLRTSGKQLSVLKLDYNQRELLALIGERGTDLIEAIIKV